MTSRVMVSEEGEERTVQDDIAGTNSWAWWILRWRADQTCAWVRMGVLLGGLRGDVWAMWSLGMLVCVVVGWCVGDGGGLMGSNKSVF